MQTGSSWAAAHVVIFPFPAQGHINAAMDMAKKLASFGISITFVCTEVYIANMQKEGLDVDSEGLPIRLVGLPDCLPSDKSTTDRLDQVSVLIEATENMGTVFEDMLSKLKEENPIACIIYDFMLWWIGDVGKRHMIPSYLFFPMSASFFSFLTHIPSFISQRRLPLGSSTDLCDKSNMFNMPGFPSLHASELPDIAWDPNPVCSFDYILRITRTWRDATGILLNTVYEFEEETIEALRQEAQEMDIRAVGPILPPSFLQQDEVSSHAAEGVDPQGCVEWLDKQPLSSVLYIAFGTIAILSTPQIHELAMGLEASHHRFLWVVRFPKDHSKGFDQPCPLPRGFEERTKERGMVVWDLAPQRRVLAHKALGGFLTHCGWNSTLESLCKGVPLLCWPMFADQGMNCKFLVDMLEIGKRLEKGEDGLVDRKEVEKMIGLLMDQGQDNKQGQLLRQRASTLQGLVSKAVLLGGSSYEHVDGFVQIIFQ